MRPNQALHRTRTRRAPVNLIRWAHKMKTICALLFFFVFLACGKPSNNLVMGRLGKPVETSLKVQGRVVTIGKAQTDYFQVEQVDGKSLERPIRLGLFNARNPHPFPNGLCTVEGYEYKQWHGAPNTKGGGEYSDQFVITRILEQEPRNAQQGGAADALSGRR
jgi:hypothetical protein